MSREWLRKRENEKQDSSYVSWDEVGELYCETTFVEKSNRTYEDRIHYLKNRLRKMKELLLKMHGYQNPIERVILEERLDFLIKRFNEFTYQVNPHHIQPGLIVDINVTTIKRKQYMLKGMANVLNEFLYGVSKGFADAAFAQFKRRRSTVRADIDQTFKTEDKKEDLFSLAYSDVMTKGQPEQSVKGTVNLSPSRDKGGAKKKSGLKEL